MNKLLKIALCGFEPTQDKIDELKEVEADQPLDSSGSVQVNENTAIRMSGPLAEIYTKALRMVFSKDAPSVDMQSQANDAIVAISTARLQNKINSTDALSVTDIAKSIQFDSSDIEKGLYSAFAIDSDEITKETIPTLSIKGDKDLVDRKFFIVQYDNNNKQDDISSSKTAKQINDESLKKQAEFFNYEIVYGLENFVKLLMKKKT